MPKEETEMKLYGAIDLHSNNNVVVLSDEEDALSMRSACRMIWR